MSVTTVLNSVLMSSDCKAVGWKYLVGWYCCFREKFWPADVEGFSFELLMLSRRVNILEILGLL